MPGPVADLSPAARPPVSRPRPARAARPAPAAPARRAAAPISCALTAPPSSSSARSAIASACSPRAARSTQRAGTPGGASTGSRWRRFISRSAISGRQRATSRRARASAASTSAARRARSASPTSGSWRRSAGWAVQVTAAPTAHRHQARARSPSDDRGLAGLQGGVVEGPRTAEPDRVALDRERRADAGRARRPGAGPARPTRVSVPSATRQPRDGVGGVVAQHGVDQQVGDHQAAQPGRRPPREAGGGGQQGGHGASTIRVDRVAPMTAVLEFADVTVRRGQATLLDGIDWTVEEDERWVVLGPQRRRQDHAAAGGRRADPPHDRAWPASSRRSWARSTSSTCGRASA